MCIRDRTTGEVLAEAGALVDKELAETLQNAAVPYVMIQGPDRNYKVLSNRMVDLAAYVDFDPKEIGIAELVYYPVLKNILEEAGGEQEALKVLIHRKMCIRDRY